MANLVNNTTDLQAILNEVSSYKEIIETQDSLITQLSTALDGKAISGGSGDSKKYTVTITANPYYVSSIYFSDGDITISAGDTQTIDFYGPQLFLIVTSSDYIDYSSGGCAEITHKIFTTDSDPQRYAIIRVSGDSATGTVDIPYA